MKTRLSRHSVRFLLGLLAGSLALACAGPRPAVVTEPPPAPPQISPEERQQELLTKIAEVNSHLDANAARKDEVVADMAKELERLRGLRQARQAEAEGTEQALAVLRERVADRRARLEELRAQGDSSSSLVREQEREVQELESEVAREATAFTARQQAAAEVVAAVERFEKVGRENYFYETMRPLYREGIDLYLDYYRAVLDTARTRLAEGDNVTLLIDRVSRDLKSLESLGGRDVKPDAFATSRRRFEINRRMSQAWLSTYILEVRFSPSEYRLGSISEDERQELDYLLGALADYWPGEKGLEIYVDGHADSKKFRGQNDCVSATKNKELSRRRAEAVGDYLADHLTGAAGRIHVDWHGNFSLQAAAQPHQGESENRRIELRIVSLKADGTPGSYREYFKARSDLELGGRSFVRRPGRWVEAACVEREKPDAEVSYLSAAYQELVARLGLEASASAALGGGREWLVSLGNDFIVADGERCIAVRPCSDPSPQAGDSP